MTLKEFIRKKIVVLNDEIQEMVQEREGYIKEMIAADSVEERERTTEIQTKIAEAIYKVLVEENIFRSKS